MQNWEIFWLLCCLHTIEKGVYNSDLKKLFQWFNLLAEKGLLVEEEKDEKPAKKKAATKEAKEDKPAKPKAKSEPKGKKGSTKKVKK